MVSLFFLYMVLRVMHFCFLFHPLKEPSFLFLFLRNDGKAIRGVWSGVEWIRSVNMFSVGIFGKV